MNKHLLYLLVALIPFFANARPEKDEISITTKDSVVGYTIANKQIIAGVCEFPLNITRFSIDSGQDQAIVVLREVKDGKAANRGLLAAFDIKSQKITWNFEIRNFSIDRTKDLIIYHNVEKTRYFNLKDGKLVNSGSQRFAFTDYKDNIGFDGMYGIDLFTNRSVWKRKIKGNDMLRSFTRLNDSTVIILCEGLHQVNMKTGEGWDYELSTRKEDAGNVLAAIGTGIATGLLTGVAVVPNTEKVGIVSNILSDDNRLYIAGKGTLACLDKNGNVQWETEISSKLMSASTLFTKGENLYMVNSGYAFMGQGATITGRPFFAAFNRKDGKLTFMDTFNKKEALYSHLAENGACLIYTGDSVYKIDMNTGAYSKYLFPAKDKKTVFGFIKGDDIFTESEAGDFVTLKERYPDAYFMENNRAEILVFNDRFEGEELLTPNKYWSHVSVYKGKDILLNNEGYVAFAENGHKLAILQPAYRNYIVADILYRVTPAALQILPLKNIME